MKDIRMDKEKVLKYLISTFRIIIGLVFIFSGFVKGVDPLGTTYKLIDYFDAFQIGFLIPLAFPFSIVLNMSEFILGIALIIGIFPKLFLWLATVYMALFTPLTFVLAIYNPVTDCGCFGDAIVMSNWQTFFKNIVLVVLLIPVFICRKKIQVAFSQKGQWTIIILSIIGFIFLSAYTYRHLPFVDFRPYKIETYIPHGMYIPEGVPADSFSYSVVYKKGKTIKEFSIENIPIDTTWKWIETKSKLERKGYHPPIHDFSFTNQLGENVTDSILYDTNYVFLAISHKLNKVSEEGLIDLKSIYKHSKVRNYKFYLATASTSDEIHQYMEELSLPFSFYMADDIMLKTIVRANPGLVLIKNGTIINKWHFNDFPSGEELNIMYKNEGEKTNKRSGEL